MAERACDVCGKPYTAKRSTSRYCGPSCRSRASQMGGAPVIPIGAKHADDEPKPGLMESTVRAELDAAGRTDTVLGVGALALARRIDGSARETGPALAGLVKQLEATMSSATAGAVKARDEFDEIRAARERKHAG